MIDKEWEEHPSYGMITVTRAQVGGRGLALFGSDAMHHHCVNVEIRNAKRKRDLSTEWYHGDKTLNSFMMTEGQWARFVSSFGDGNGTPVTFRYTESNLKIPPCPDPIPIITPFDADITERANLIKNAAQNAKSKVAELLASKKPATKAELGTIAGLLDTLLTNVHSNLGFVEKCFKEKMQHHLDQSMVNFEQQVAHSLKMKGLGEMLKQFQASGSLQVAPDTITLPAPQE